MNYMTKIADYEAAVERRLEKSCERNGWIASAHVSFAAWAKRVLLYKVDQAIWRWIAC